MELKTKWCSSLVKVLPAKEPESVPYRSGTALRGEVFSFQLAYRPEGFHLTEIHIEIESELKKHISVRRVNLVPVEYTGTAFDDDYISRDPGLYPDLLSELENNAVEAICNQWRSLWFKVEVPKNCKPGKYRIDVTLSVRIPGAEEQTIRKKMSFTLEVLNAQLPPQKLINTHWFHTDCLAVYYRIDVFSEEYWRIVGNFMKSAAEHGINMILTPLFTPPLDTLPGTERPTVQLVDVTRKKGRYSFGFRKLERWIELAEKCGIRYFEISHLFTQWGAKFTPKIMAKVDGAEKRIFGWDVKSDSREYTEFLDAFLPELIDFLRKRKLQRKVYFHCSDEPSLPHLESYEKASAILRRHLEGFKIMDALSNVDFYKKGIIRIPVPSEVHLEEFLAAGMKERWTYYCCGPTVTYSNRFIHMPSSRNRILGTQMYYYDVEGFLHWGFNFYFSRLSKYPVDPYKCTDSGCAFSAGDPFLVYPGKDGRPEDSIRYEVFREGLQDQRAMQLLETKMPREKILRELDKLSPGGKMSMANYPRGEKNMLAVRAKINQLIKKHFA